MSAPQKFRFAFNGFNREDVVHYLEYINSKHTAEVNQLTSELEYLRNKQETQQPVQDQAPVIAALEQERDALQAQVAELTARCEALTQNVPVAACCTDNELEIYRRAERTERMARERADLIYRQTTGVVAEASVRVNDMASQVAPMAEQVLAQLAELQNTIASGKQSLQEAAVILSTLRPNDN